MTDSTQGQTDQPIPDPSNPNAPSAALNTATGAASSTGSTAGAGTADMTASNTGQPDPNAGSALTAGVIPASLTAPIVGANSSPNASGVGIQAGSLTQSAPSTAITPKQVSPEVRDIFVAKAKVDVEEAYHYLVKEIHKLYTAIEKI